MSHTYGGIDDFPALLTMPDDGDDYDAASVNVPDEGSANRTIWLKNRLNERFEYGNDTNSGGDPLLVESFDNNVIANAWTKSTVVLVDVPSCAAFDTLICHLHIGQTIMPAGKSFSFRLYSIDDYGGAAVDAAVLYSHGGRQVTDANDDMGFSTAGRHPVGTAGTCRIGLEIRPSTVGAWVLDVYSGIYLEVQRIKF